MVTGLPGGRFTHDAPAPPDTLATETGRPYFVMELVQGVSITEYCDRNRLSIKDRLALFLSVCGAIQHTHQKGIIHRDIKPSSVMVTLQDGEPITKVIDFGIAKATNIQLTDKTLFTRHGQLIGTPAYMSPEQAEIAGWNVGTRTAIYTLGVLLYELLAGATPFDAEKLHRAGCLELQRIICKEEPSTPSAKSSTLGEDLKRVAECRNTRPSSLRPSIRGDLDWIVMKSLEKDRTRRYETAHALAEDIQRYLRHEPILARSPGPLYRLQKFWQRHRYRMMAALVVLALLVGLAMSSALYLRSVKAQWAHQEALPMIAKLVERGEYVSAFFLAKEAEDHIADDPGLGSLWSEISRPYSVRTIPAGADLYYKDHSDIAGEWLYLGCSPTENIRFPKGVYRLKACLQPFCMFSLQGSHERQPKEAEILSQRVALAPKRLEVRRLHRSGGPHGPDGVCRGDTNSRALGRGQGDRTTSGLFRVSSASVDGSGSPAWLAPRPSATCRGLPSATLAAAVGVFRNAALAFELPEKSYADRASIFDSAPFREGLADPRVQIAGR